MATCRIETYLENPEEAFEKAKEMGIWGGCSYGKNGITFQLHGHAPFAKLHEVAQEISGENEDYVVSVMQFRHDVEGA